MTRYLCPLLCTLACIVLSACTGGAAVPDTGATPQAVLAMPAPEGVDGALWAQLTARLAAELEQGQGGVNNIDQWGRRLAAHPEERRQAAAATKGVLQAGDPPSGPSASAQLSYSASSARLSWYYTAPGDYDQNGEVNASDLLPLAKHFNETSPGGAGTPWPASAVQAQIDGDSNGELTLTDVTPIGVHWKERVEGYRVYRATDPASYPPQPDDANGPGTEFVANLALSSAEGNPGLDRLLFSLQLVPTATPSHYWVRPTAGGQDGAASNLSPAVVIVLPGNQPPVAVLATPPDMGTAAHVVWDATGSTDADGGVVKFEFDYGADGVYEETHELVDPDGTGGNPPFWTGGGGPGSTGEAGTGNAAMADFWYYEPGTFACRVRVTDTEGAVDIAQASVNVSELEKWQTRQIVTTRYERPLSEPGYWPVDLKEVNGRPAFVYSYWVEDIGLNQFGNLVDGGRGLWLIAKDPTGQDWHPPVEISENREGDSTPTSPETTGAIEGTINGKVAGWYSIHPAPVNYAYRHSLDGDGRSWPAPGGDTIIDNSTNAGYMTDLLEIGGKPVLLATQGVYLALDSEGIAWTPRQDYGNLPGSLSAPTKVKLVDGIPSFVYRAGFIDLLFCSAASNDCTSWNAPHVVTKSETVGEGWQFLVINDKPGIIYWEENTNTARYRGANDSAGTSWRDPVVVADYASAFNSSDQRQHGFVSRGRPALVYRDRIDLVPKYVVACNQAGTIWADPITIHDIPHYEGTLGTDVVDIGGHMAGAWVEELPGSADGCDIRVMLAMYY
jgi:hypothetical protein